jgi:PAS domain S-box-containing protein
MAGEQRSRKWLRIYTPEGTQKFIHAQGSAVYDDPGKATRLIGTILDITERKREENRGERRGCSRIGRTHPAESGVAHL